MPRKLLIRNVYVADPSSAPCLRPGTRDILIEDNRIAAIEEEIGIAADEVIDGRNAIACPGMADSHRHIWQTAIRGVAADWSLADYVREIRVGYATAYSPEDVYLANLVGSLEAIDTGVTSICDFSHIMNSPAHTEAAIAGIRESGIRGVFCYGFYDVPTRNRSFKLHEERIRHADSVARSFNSTGGSLLNFGVALTEFGLVTPDQTDAELDLARRHDALITLHVGTFGSPHAIQSLEERGKLGPDMLHVHGNMSHDAEIAALVRSGGGLSITPETEMQMGMGWPVTNRLLEAGGLPSFGVDIVSDCSGDLLTQLRLAVQTARAIDNQDYLDKGIVPDKIALSVRDALRFGTEGGAQAMKLGSDIGRIAVGARADLVLFRTDGTNMIPFTDPVAMLMLQSRPGDAETVLIDGQVRKRDGRLAGVDLDALRTRMTERFHRIAEEVAFSADLESGTSMSYANVIRNATQTGG